MSMLDLPALSKSGWLPHGPSRNGRRRDGQRCLLTEPATASIGLWAAQMAPRYSPDCGRCSRALDSVPYSRVYNRPTHGGVTLSRMELQRPPNRQSYGALGAGAAGAGSALAAVLASSCCLPVIAPLVVAVLG